METYLTVSALTKYIKAKLEGDKHLVSIYLKGEISNFKRHSRGHLYFTLKDEGAQIGAIMFAGDTLKLQFAPKDGDHVLVQGRINLYEPSGSYSIRIGEMQPDGIGELYLKYEALKKEIESRGWFKDEHKQPIPRFPKRIGVVTSPTGAVIQDIRHTVERRWLLTEIHLYPAQVQGPDGTASIVSQIRHANARNEVDVLIVGRGGGSIEDLWCFNELPVIEAIFHSKIPVITAIGHETDYTIADFVSDLRAPTPTAAAELATPDKKDLLERLADLVEQGQYRIQALFEQRKTQLVHLDQRLDRLSPTERFEAQKRDLDRLGSELAKGLQRQLEWKSNQIERLATKLVTPKDKIERLKNFHIILASRLATGYEHMLKDKTHRFALCRTGLSTLNPLALMERGFAVVEKADKVVSSIQEVETGDAVTIRFKDGRADANITGKKA